MDALTTSVLKDVTLLVWLALLAGAGAYKALRLARPAACWNWGGRVNVRSYIAADAVVVAALSLLLLGGLRQAGAATATTADPELSAPVVAGGIFVQLFAAAMLLFYLGGVRGLHAAELFGIRRLGALPTVGLTLVLMLPLLLVVNGVAWSVNHWLQSFWPDLEAQDAVRAFRDSGDTAARLALVAAAVGVAPLVEELLFRGFIYGVIKRFTDAWFAALCSSLLFAVVHLHVGSLLPLAVLALLLCAAYELTGSLLVPMLLHALFNLTSLALLLIFPEAAA
jgi:membrane protease YdiL (CAAX protease family)